jgi:hypothetical protein
MSTLSTSIHEDHNNLNGKVRAMARAKVNLLRKLSPRLELGDHPLNLGRLST